MRIVITGHRGFLGRYVVERLIGEHELIGVIRPGSRSDSDIHNLKEIPWDQLVGSTHVTDAVVMCHAHIGKSQWGDTAELFRSNVKFTEEVRERFPSSYCIYISSTSVYGHTPALVDESTKPTPQSPYAISKLWGEVMASKSGDTAIVRASSIYGQGMRDNTIIPYYVSQAIRTGQIHVWGKGLRLQNYIHAEDVAGMVSSALEKRAIGTFLAVGDRAISNLELAEIISRHSGGVINFQGEDSSPSFSADGHATLSALEWEGKLTRIEDGIADYIGWRRRQSSSPG